MTRSLIVYSTVDGHTRAIAERLRDQLAAHGGAVTLAPIGKQPGTALSAFDRIVVGACIRYGKHRPEVYEFIERNARVLQRRPNAFFSVNVVARKPGKDTPEGNPYVRKFLREIAWRPALVGVFAGKIDYKRYGLVDRNVIRLIMLMTDGPTDPSACVDFTDWAAVEAFGRRLAS
jgi:menaquinone-dependent protoporphyrinogen oxidase